MVPFSYKTWFMHRKSALMRKLASGRGSSTSTTKRMEVLFPAATLTAATTPCGATLVPPALSFPPSPLTAHQALDLPLEDPWLASPLCLQT